MSSRFGRTVIIDAETHVLTCHFCDSLLAGQESVCLVCGCIRPSAPPALPLTGREREQAALQERIDRCIAGQGGLYGITGPAGIGKTRLTEAALAYAKERRCFDFFIRGFEPNADLPYWALIEALNAEMALMAGALAPPAETGRDGPLAVMRNLMEALRSGREPAPGSTAGFESRDSGVSARVYEANAAAVRGLAAVRPLVIVADDLQWFDTPTLNLMRHALRIAKALPVLLLCTYRDDGESASRFRPLLEDAAREGVFAELHLEGLAPAAARRLALTAASASLSDRDIEQVLRLAEGNPFYITQLARTFANPATREDRVPLPSALGGLTDQRLAGLSQPCRTLVQAVAVVGRECPLDLLICIVTAPLAELAAALDEALTAHVLVERETAGRTRYALTHPLLREAAVRELNALARAWLHLRIADALHERRAAGSHDAAVEVAGHYLEARALAPPDRVLTYVREAADEAEALGAYDQAARFLTAALELAREQGTAPAAIAALHIRLLEAHGRVGDVDAARRAAESALTFFQSAGDARAAAEVHALLAEHLNPRIRPREVVAHTDAGLALVGASRTPLSARLRYLRAHALHMADDSVALLPTADWLDAGGFEPSEPTAAVWSRLLRVLWHIWNSVTTTDSLRLLAEATVHARRVGDRRAEALTRLWEAQILERDARPHAALVALDAARDLARETGSAAMLVDAGALRADALLQLGRWDELEETVAETLPMLVRLGSTYFGYELITAYAWSRRLRGLPWQPLHGLELLLRESGPFVAAMRANAAREAAEAGALDQRGARLLDWVARHVPVEGPGLAWAMAGVPALGALTLAGRRDAVAARYGGVTRFPRLLVYTSFASLELGRAAMLLRQWDVAAAHFAEGERIAADEGLAVVQGRILLERGTLYRLRARRGDRSRAVAELERAAEICAALGLSPDAARARSLLDQIGPVAPPSLPAGLTRREAEVLQLLAAGRTNRQIANDLTISEKTVEQHLLNIYQKLQVDSRAKAVAFAYAHGLTG